MLPTKILHLDLYDILSAVEEDIQQISDISTIDYIIAISTTGTFPASIISKKINKPMFFIDYSEDSILKFIAEKENVSSILLVDLICSNEKIQDIADIITKINPHCIVKSYSTFVSKSAVNRKPNYYHLCADNYYLTPWNQNSITPDTHLERLFNDDIYKHSKNSKMFCFSSRETYLNLITQYNKEIPSNELLILDEQMNIEINQKSLNETLNSSKLKLNKYYCSLFEIITNNGVTDYFSNSIKDSIIVSSEFNNLNVVYVEEDFSYKLRINKIKF